ncbi:MAG: MerR family transcriptional regulator [Clostridiales bacterium]|uniref:MerR family transcriptional regulator n=1 Tax=Clostridium sp. N3C TaxID=1776758 RepID=UPI00092E066D|nr:MerR family transcriptional regulator [Clostridium sp. N3C]NLZ48015.1 MerR family transcriptional regulator [Clostridiales bacterium]SCN24851.1 Multidrug transporter activation protein [Clostridium sp. N3C]
MEYTVQKLGKLAGVSPRTLRYYDEIGILKPARINSSGYRIYGQEEVDKLQQILFYRELGMGLEAIKDIINSPSFNSIAALKEHREKLLAKRKQIDMLIVNVEKTIASEEGRIDMSNAEKFEGFKDKIIEENEKKYGKEIREKYGDDAVERSNKAFKNMSKEDYDKMIGLEREIKMVLAEAYKSGDPASDLAQKAADLHKQWISMAWGYYNKEAHAGLAQMYVEDERFTAYYDKEQPGTAKFLRDAIYIYTGMSSK